MGQLFSMSFGHPSTALVQMAGNGCRPSLSLSLVGSGPRHDIVGAEPLQVAGGGPGWQVAGGIALGRAVIAIATVLLRMTEVAGA